MFADLPMFTLYVFLYASSLLGDWLATGLANARAPRDVPPIKSANRDLVKFVFNRESEREKAVYR